MEGAEEQDWLDAMKEGAQPYWAQFRSNWLDNHTIWVFNTVFTVIFTFVAFHYVYNTVTWFINAVVMRVARWIANVGFVVGKNVLWQTMKSVIIAVIIVVVYKIVMMYFHDSVMTGVDYVAGYMPFGIEDVRQWVRVHLSRQMLRSYYAEGGVQADEL